jgi:hypothetical protein
MEFDQWEKCNFKQKSETAIPRRDMECTYKSFGTEGYSPARGWDLEKILLRIL